MRVIADTHLAPGETLKEPVDLLNGDGMDLIPRGYYAYRDTLVGQATIRSIAENVKVYVAGNHDPLWMLEKVFAGYDIILCEEYVCEF